MITAVSTSMFGGQAVPTLTAAFTGFVNRDTPTSLTTAPVLHSAAGPSSAPGSYPITVGGASSPNYKITYVPGTLTVILSPATVERVSIQKVKLSKHKRVQEIVLQFSEALDWRWRRVSARTPWPRSRRTRSRRASRCGSPSASYNASAFTVTLLTPQDAGAEPPLELTVKAASLLDALGRELDGNDSGQSARISRPSSARQAPRHKRQGLARIGGLSSHLCSVYRLNKGEGMSRLLASTEVSKPANSLSKP